MQIAIRQTCEDRMRMSNLNSPPPTIVTTQDMQTIYTYIWCQVTNDVVHQPTSDFPKLIAFINSSQVIQGIWQEHVEDKATVRVCDRSAKPMH